MIEVQNLSKSYGDFKAVDDVSFTVNKGEILGFLGRTARENDHDAHPYGIFASDVWYGAGGGFDVFNDSIDVRRHIGYLPEAPPVYLDMTVAAYLDFVARIKGVPSEKRASAVADAMEKTSITDRRDQIIKRLSRGYKQRVGLAQALVHDPDVIILDEPTIGLDPKQIIEVRNLIKGLAGSHTIILSTHILPEVSMTCDRVVIINKGKIAAVGTPENLTSQLEGGQKIHVETRAPEAGLRAALGAVQGITNLYVEKAPGGENLSVTLETSRGADARSEVAARIIQNGFPLFELRGVSLSLEDIFLELTTDDAAHAEAVAP